MNQLALLEEPETERQRLFRRARRFARAVASTHDRRYARACLAMLKRAVRL